MAVKLLRDGEEGTELQLSPVSTATTTATIIAAYFVFALPGHPGTATATAFIRACNITACGLTSYLVGFTTAITYCIPYSQQTFCCTLIQPFLLLNTCYTLQLIVLSITIMQCRMP
jgi:hypothetical protein